MKMVGHVCLQAPRCVGWSAAADCPTWSNDRFTQSADNINWAPWVSTAFWCRHTSPSGIRPSPGSATDWQTAASGQDQHCFSTGMCIYEMPPSQKYVLFCMYCCVWLPPWRNKQQWYLLLLMLFYCLFDEFPMDLKLISCVYSVSACWLLCLMYLVNISMHVVIVSILNVFTLC